LRARRIFPSSHHLPATRITNPPLFSLSAVITGNEPYSRPLKRRPPARPYPPALTICLIWNLWHQLCPLVSAMNLGSSSSGAFSPPSRHSLSAGLEPAATVAANEDNSTKYSRLSNGKTQRQPYGELFLLLLPLIACLALPSLVPIEVDADEDDF